MAKMKTGTKVVLGLGVAAAVGGAVWYFLKGRAAAAPPITQDTQSYPEVPESSASFVASMVHPVYRSKFLNYKSV